MVADQMDGMRLASGNIKKHWVNYGYDADINHFETLSVISKDTINFIHLSG